MKITITRQKIHRRGCPGPAWSWVYFTDAPMKFNPDFNVGGYDRLSALITYLKRNYPGCIIVKEWEEQRQAVK